MYFVGYTRFSLFSPDSKAWAASSGRQMDEDEYRKYLYSPERMEPRAHIFFEHSLPTLNLAVRDHQVRHVVSYSVEMPTVYKERMAEAADRYSWLVLDPFENGIGTINVDRIARTFMDQRARRGVYGWYRLDDDDLLPIDYYDRMASYATESNVGMYVSLGAGITAVQDGELFRNPRHVVQRMIAIGLLAVCRYEENGSSTRPSPTQAHNRADESAPVIIDSRDPGFYWNRSVTQDTVFATTDGSASSARAGIDRFLAGLPAVEKFEPVYSRFPTLRHKLKPVRR
ncbi:glycosyltransferase [Brachybacterium tyrofermentans]|uniref:glycosyltransferase n=1 Tax=Brachybacterium tyrofermentans TaxID=47848 RepID=UPI003FD430E7